MKTSRLIYIVIICRRIRGGRACSMHGCEIHTKIVVETFLPSEMYCFDGLGPDGRVTLLEDI
jgi:hypothetical protein